MNFCATNACRQGREPCPTPLACGAPVDESAIHAARLAVAMNAPIRRIEYAGDEPEEFTQSEALGFCESALYFAIGAAAVAAVLFVAVQVWPLLPLMTKALQ